MSFHIDSKKFSSEILLFFLILGLLMRAFGLFYFPPGMEADEAVVVYWGRKWLQEGRLVLMASGELPPWETPAAYFFGALDLIGISPRWGAVALSFLEVGLCYLWSRRRTSKQIALLSATFLSLMPWHFFFSFVLGPCVAGLWTSLYLLEIKNPVGRIAVSVGGLLYYASFRVLLIWSGLRALLNNRWKFLVNDILAGLIALGLLLLLGIEQFKAFFSKGSYLLDRGLTEALHHYLNSVVLWWVPPLQMFWPKLSAYSMDDVGYGFANVLVWSSPLSYGISIFFAMGLFYCYKFKENRDLLGLFLLTVFFLGFSPSYVHFPFILPVVAFVSAQGASYVVERKKGGIYWCYTALLIGVCTLIFMMSGFGSRDRWRIFSGDSEAVPKLISQYTDAKTVWTVGLDYSRARLVADRVDIPLTFFGTDSNDWLMRMRLLQSQHKAQWVFIQGLSLVDHPRPELQKIFRESHEEYLKRLKLFENNNFIKGKQVLSFEGYQLGVLYELGN